MTMRFVTIVTKRTALVSASVALLAAIGCRADVSLATRGQSESIEPPPTADSLARSLLDSEAPTRSSPPRFDPPRADPSTVAPAIEESLKMPAISRLAESALTATDDDLKTYDSSTAALRPFELTLQEAEITDWTDRGPPRHDVSYLLEDLPTIHDVIDALHASLAEIHSNVFDFNTPIGALCWSIWEASRAFFQDKYGYFFVESLRIFESEVAKQRREDVPAEQESTPLSNEIESGATGRTTETPEYPNDYSILESLEAVAEGPIRARAMDSSLPPAYLKLSQDFFAAIDYQRTLPEPEGFDLESFTSDYVSDPGGVEMLDCFDHVVGNVEEPTAATTTTVPEQPVRISPEAEDAGSTTGTDAPSIDNTGDSDDADTNPTPASTTTTTSSTTTTTTSSTTTTTTTTVVSPPAPRPPEDGQDQKDTDNPGDGKSEEESDQQEGTDDSDGS